MNQLRKILIATFLFGCVIFALNGPQQKSAELSAAQLKAGVPMEISCGQCQLGMSGSGCDLAVRFGGRTYWVSGTGIDDHGDAHGDHGFCNAIRQGTVAGEIHGDRFVVDSLALQPAAK